MSVVDQKRIAKNTLLLYIRMGVIMLICFYTSRVILDTLGEVDYGLYNVIGGIVVAFSFLNGVMTTACNRYFAIEIGKGDYDALKKIFSLNITIFILLGLCILVLSETLGLWFLNAKMVIPAERHIAANWVYQFSILAFLINMMGTPYRAIIIAKEKMKVFAYCSVIEAMLRLGIVYLLTISPFDKLIFYAILMLLVTIGISGFYILYCSYFYKECHYTFYWDKLLFKDIIGYTGWQIIGSMAGIGRSQGLNIILNMFFGPIINAARGVAYQVYINIYQLAQNFAMAFNPQIYKSFATNETKAMINLVYRSSKISYYLIFLFALPIFIEAPIILSIWLKEVPEQAVLFCRLMLIISLIDSMGISLGTSVMATGKIKWYQITIGGCQLLSVVIAYSLFKFGNFEPAMAFILSICSSIASHILRVYFLKKHFYISIKEYFSKALLPILNVTLTASIISYLVKYYCPNTTFYSILIIILSFSLVGLIVFTIGINQEERTFLINSIKQKIGLINSQN